MKLVGRRLHEDVEAGISSFIEKLDPDKLDKMPDNDKESLYKAAEEAVGDDAKGNEDDIKTFVDGAILSSKVKAGTDSDSNIVKQYLKEKRETIQKRLQEVQAGFVESPTDDLTSIARDNVDLDTSSEAFYASHPENDLNLSEDDFDSQADYVEELLSQGMDASEVVTLLLETSNLDYDDARDMVESITGEFLDDGASDNGYSDDLDFDGAGEGFDEYDPAIDNEVEAEFDEALDEFDEANDRYDDHALYEHICKKFAIDEATSREVLREAGNVYDAVTSLAERVRESRRLREAKPSSLLGHLLKNIPKEKEKDGTVTYSKRAIDRLFGANIKEVQTAVNNIMGNETITTEDGKNTDQSVFWNEVQALLGKMYYKDEITGKKATLATIPTLQKALGDIAPMIQSAKKATELVNTGAVAKMAVKRDVYNKLSPKLT